MTTKTRTVLRRLLPKNTFARGVSVLVGGTAGAQLLTVLAAPLLTRLYSPEDFGLLAVYASLLALIGVISSLRYELAIPLPEDDGEAANVAVLSLILVGISALLSGVLVLLLGTAIADALGVPALAGYFWLLPVGVLLGGAYSVFNYWSVRTKRFGTIAGTKLSQALATVAIQLAGLKLGGIALLYAQVAGQSVGTASLARRALANPGFRQVSWHGIRHAAVRYRRFPIFSTGEGFANSAGTQLPPLMFAAFFSPTAVGLYALAHRVLTLPMSLVGGAVSQVFFSTAAEAHRRGNLGQLVNQLHSKLVHIGLPPALILFLLGPELFVFVFGAQWRQAGDFARWMSPWLYLQFVSSSLSIVFPVMESQKQGLAFQIITLISRIIAILIGVWVGNLFITIALFASASALSYLLLLIWVALLSGARLVHIFKSNFISFLYSILIAAPILISQYTQSYASCYTLLAIVTSGLLLLFRYLFLARKAY